MRTTRTRRIACFYAALVLLALWNAVPPCPAQILSGDTSGGIVIDPRAARFASEPQADATRDMPEELCCVSLKRWQRTCQTAAADAHVLSPGFPLAEIRYVLLLPHCQDIVLAGPQPRAPDDEQQRRLAQQRQAWLWGAIEFARQRTSQPLGCSIEPAADRVDRLLAATTTMRASHPFEQAQRLKQQLGPQRIRVFGVTADSPLAALVVEADVQLKQLAMGTRASGIAHVSGLIDLLPAQGASGMPRVWIEACFAPAQHAMGGRALALTTPHVAVHAAASTQGAHARNRSAAHVDGAQRWAATVAEHYEQLAQHHPVFARLIEAMNYCQVAALLASDDLAAWPELQLSALRPPPQERSTVPDELETIVQLKQANRRTIVVLGGVAIDPWHGDTRPADNPLLKQLWETCRLPADPQQWCWQQEVRPGEFSQRRQPQRQLRTGAAAPLRQQIHERALSGALPVALSAADWMARRPAASDAAVLEQMMRRAEYRANYALRCATMLAATALPQPQRSGLLTSASLDGQLHLLVAQRLGCDSPGQLPQFYGVPVAGNRVVFVIDKSASMKLTAQRASSNRWSQAVLQLSNTLQQLPATTHFNVVPFDRRPRPWRAGWTLADEHARRDAIHYLMNISCGGRTDLQAAIEYALLAHPECEAIYVLTDGESHGGAMFSPHKLLQHVAQHNYTRRASIYTLGIQPAPDAEQLLRTMAGENLGCYMRIE